MYGYSYIGEYIRIAKLKYKKASEEECVLYACMQKYKEMMISAFGDNARYIVGAKMMSIETLMMEDFKTFKETIVNLANSAISFVRDNVTIYDNNYVHDPNLSINHIAGLADIIDEKTIIDIKCTSSLKEEHIFQVLGYHYLSTKRDDLKINNLIVFDVVKNRYIKIDIENKEVTTNYK